MPSWYDPPFGVFTTNIERIKKRLYSIDTATITSDVTARTVAGEMRAFVYVWLAAALEDCIKALLHNLVDELNALSLPVVSLRPELFGLLLDAKLASIRDLADYERTWSAKCELFQLASANRPAQFSSDVLPLDKKTLRPKHFDIVWMVFGLPNNSMPSPRHRLALTSLAEGRNEVAHGSIDPESFGRAKANGDVQRLTDQVEEIVFHLVSSADQYLSTRTYLRR